MDTFKLIGFVIGQDNEQLLKLALESLKGCYRIFYLDGGSTDNSLEIAKKLANEVLENKWDKNKNGMAGIQKNIMLDYLKKYHLGEWCIYIDSDEILDDNGVRNLRDFIEKGDKNAYSMRMRHLIYNLTYEDATREVHQTPVRLFKITEKLNHSEVEHCILEGYEKDVGFCNILLWHLAYCGSIWEVRRRYYGQKNRIGIGSHTLDFLKFWRNSHLFGSYPVKQFKPEELPSLLLKEFDMDKDEIYFANRGIEIKHPMMVKQWYDYFKPKSVLVLGCGKGPYLYFWEWFVEKCYGMEISEYAIKNKFCKAYIYHDNVGNREFYPQVDLITAVDILEHLSDEDLDKTLKNIFINGKQFLFSIPFIGDPNLEADLTHIQKKTREEWITLIESYGIKIKPTPEDWMFKEQILVGEKK